MLLLGSIRSIMKGCIRIDNIFFRKPTRPSLPLRKGVLKSSRPSLPLKKAPPLISVFSPQGRRGKPPSGARNRFAIRLADHQRSAPYFAGWDRLGIACYGLLLWTWRLPILDNLLITCRFLVFFLVISRKKRNFGGI